MQGKGGIVILSSMLRKFIARLRESIAPSPKKPAQAAPQSAQRPQGGTAPRRPAAGGGNRSREHGPREHGAREHAPREQGPRSQVPRQGGPSQRQAPRAAPEAGRAPSREGRLSRSGPSRHGGRGGFGDDRKARPARDDFEHPGHTSAKPAIPVDVPKMDTPFSKLGLSDALAYAVQESRASTELDAHPGPQAIPLDPGGRVTSSARPRRERARPPRLRCPSSSVPRDARPRMRCLILEPHPSSSRSRSRRPSTSTSPVYGPAGDHRLRRRRDTGSRRRT